MKCKENKLVDGDYTLADGRAWFTVKAFSVRVSATDDGVFISVYKKGEEMADEVASAYAFD